MGDFLKLLDQVPLWRRLTALPARVEALEARLAEVEAQLRQRPALGACLVCGGALTVTDEKPHPDFGVFGQKLLTLTCAGCGRTTTRDVDPGAAHR